MPGRMAPSVSVDLLGSICCDQSVAVAPFAVESSLLA